MQPLRIWSSVFVLLLAAGAAAADVRYQSETQVHFAGTLGTVMRMFGGSKPVASTVSLKGNVLRTDSENNSQIVDLDRAVFIDLDHKKKQYVEMTFEEMKQRLEEASKKLQEESASQAPARPQNGTQVHFKAAVQPTGKKQTLDGHETESVTVTLAVEGQDSTGAAGSMLATSEMWMAKDVPEYAEMRAFGERFAAKFGTDVLGGAKFLDVLAANAPELAASVRELQKESRRVEGAPLLSTLRVDGAASPAPGTTTTAPGEPAPEAKSEGIKIEKPSIGGVLGRFGKKKAEESQQKKAEEQAAAGGRTNLFTSTTRLSGFSTAALGPEVFEIPAAYKKVQLKE